MDRKCLYSLVLFLLPPSAMLVGIETAARVSWIPAIDNWVGGVTATNRDAFGDGDLTGKDIGSPRNLNYVTGGGRLDGRLN